MDQQHLESSGEEESKADTGTLMAFKVQVYHEGVLCTAEGTEFASRSLLVRSKSETLCAH